MDSPACSLLGVSCMLGHYVANRYVGGFEVSAFSRAGAGERKES